MLGWKEEDSSTVDELIQIPDEFRDLEEIEPDNLLEKIKNNTPIERFAITKDSLEVLHEAIEREKPIELFGCRIDGNLDFGVCPRVSITELRDNYSQFSDLLLDRVRTSKLLVKGFLCICNSLINGNVIGRGTMFPNVTFLGTIFNGDVSFDHAIISGSCSFEDTNFCREVYFYGTTLGHGVSFERAKFEKKTNFTHSHFTGDVSFKNIHFDKETSFRLAKFYSGTIFEGGTFGNGTYFDLTRFEGLANFSSTTFWGSALFKGDNQNSVFNGDTYLSEITFYKPSLVTFHQVSLSRTFLKNTALDKVNFINVEWAKKNNRKCVYDEIRLEESDKVKRKLSEFLATKRPRKVKIQDYPLIAHLYRQLKKNYEEARDYPGAGDFHYGEMEMTRKMHWAKGEYFSWFFTKAYKVLSGYGENIKKALFWTGVILLAPAAIYYWLGATVDESSTLGFLDSLVRSLGYMTFRISQAPNEPWAKGLMFAQALIGPIQLALATLALRRKFRR